MIRVILISVNRSTEWTTRARRTFDEKTIKRLLQVKTLSHDLSASVAKPKDLQNNKISKNSLEILNSLLLSVRAKYGNR